jgi:5-methylcytosine-specific restriction endonuclease McrA
MVCGICLRPIRSGRFCSAPACARLARNGSDRRWRAVRAAVLERDGGVCHICGKGGADEVDHVHAVRAGGDRYDERNLKAAHRFCNRSKGDRPLSTLRIA